MRVGTSTKSIFMCVFLSLCALANPCLIDHRNLSQEELMEADLHAIVCLSRNIAAQPIARLYLPQSGLKMSES